MYEPPHWTKPPQVKLAKPEPADTPAKPSTAPSIEDLAESIKTLKDGLRAMADQVAGLTARVDDMAHLPIVGVDHGSKDATAIVTFEHKPDGTMAITSMRELPAGFRVKPEWVLKAADYPLVEAALASVDTVPGGCANAIAEQEKAEREELFRKAGRMLRPWPEQPPEGSRVGAVLRIRLPSDYKVTDGPLAKRDMD